MTCYVDTSIIVPYYCPEENSEVAERFLVEQDLPVISELTEVEFCSALAKKVREGGLDQKDAGRIIASFRSHLESGFYRELHLETRHYRLASDWLGLFCTPLRSLDALHLAVSVSEGLILATADRHLAESATLIGAEHQLLS